VRMVEAVTVGGPALESPGAGCAKSSLRRGLNVRGHPPGLMVAKTVRTTGESSFTSIMAFFKYIHQAVNVCRRWGPDMSASRDAYLRVISRNPGSSLEVLLILSQAN
jgi:hypothetical protein